MNLLPPAFRKQTATPPATAITAPDTAKPNTSEPGEDHPNNCNRQANYDKPRHASTLPEVTVSVKCPYKTAGANINAISQCLFITAPIPADAAQVVPVRFVAMRWENGLKQRKARKLRAGSPCPPANAANFKQHPIPGLAALESMLHSFKAPGSLLKTFERRLLKTPKRLSLVRQIKAKLL